MKKLMTLLAAIVLLTAIQLFAADYEIHLQWTDNSSDETGFIIEGRPQADPTWYELGRVGPNITSFSYGPVPSPNPGGVVYCFRAFAENVHGRSEPSNEFCLATPTIESSVPSAPSELAGLYVTPIPKPTP